MVATLSQSHDSSASQTSESLSAEELQTIDAYWRACNYLAVGMIYLRDNPLLRSPLQAEHVKYRLLGHWGASPALSFTYVHCNRLIKKYDLDMIFMAGPGHGAPGVLGPVYLESTYSEIYPDKSQDEEGMQRFFRQFSFPGYIGSHVTPETPGSIHEGGELGYSVSHAYGAVLDNPDLIVTCVVGDGESETGPLATAWHSNKFINPARDGAVLPVLNLNGYKIANPTILARISHEELEFLFRGYGYTPYFVEGNNPAEMHEKMAAVMEECILKVREVQREARETGKIERPRWPMIVLRTPKGWTGPAEVDGKKVEDFWRSHQVPMGGMHSNPDHLAKLETWMKEYKPEELFDENGTLVPALKALAPEGSRRMSANPHANGGLLRRALKMPDFRDYAIAMEQHGTVEFENTKVLGFLMRDIMRKNPDNFRLMGPDETASNRLQAVYEVTKKVWMADIYPEDEGGTELSRDGRVMEMLSEHTLQGWLETYLLTGRHGLFHTYEAFAHVVDSMFNQHAKWLDICRNHVPWRRSVSSLNILLSSLVWRQDHNGFSHQDPGYVDLVTNKSPDVVRVYFPPDANCLLSVADHCFRSVDYINVIISDKQKHLQYLPMAEAIQHCTKGIGIWDWASNDDCGTEPDIPDVVMACCGDIPTQESLAATAILREEFPELKVRFVNVV
ncbi:MAG: phosphoketolase family protein, partial [Cyanobacteria bacterium J06629_9]